MEQNVIQINGEIMKCQFECKKRHICEKDYIWKPAACGCENGKYLASIMDDSALPIMK